MTKLNDFGNSFKVSASLVALTILLTACNTPTKAVTDVNDSSGQTQQALSNETVSAENAPETPSNIKTEARKVSNIGTNIAAIVNGEVITNNDVKRRAAFLKLRRAKGGTTIARNELVEQTLKMQEAKKLKVAAGDEQVNAAFANFAKGNRMKTSQLNQVLSRAGVTSTHFKEFIRSQISWNGVVGRRFASSSRGKSTDATMNELRKSGQEKPETNEYILQQVIFVLPKNKFKSGLKQRKIEANAFRNRFQSCETTAANAVGQRDVTIRELPRILEPQLPQEWSKQVIATPVGSATTILETDKGVEFLAVCKKKTVSDDLAASTVIRAKEFSSFNNEKGSELSKTILDELNKNSTIIYR